MVGGSRNYFSKFSKTMSSDRELRRSALSFEENFFMIGITPTTQMVGIDRSYCPYELFQILKKHVVGESRILNEFFTTIFGGPNANSTCGIAALKCRGNFPEKIKFFFQSELESPATQMVGRTTLLLFELCQILKDIPERMDRGYENAVGAERMGSKVTQLLWVV